MQEQYISLADLRKVSGIGDKTIERVEAKLLQSKLDSNYKSEYNANIQLDVNEIHRGDCLELMNGIKDNSIDMILCDLPYGTTACKWDNIISFDKLWLQYKRIIKDNGAIVLFGSQPFTSEVIHSNLNQFKYEIIWEKSKASNFLLAKKQILKAHENVLVFSKTSTIYNPQKTQGIPYSGDGRAGKKGSLTDVYNDVPNPTFRHGSLDGSRYPRSIQYFKTAESEGKQLHPTQKPIALCEWLIKTYTNEGGLVLDNCIGSGTTIIACINTNRNYIGMELDENYYNIAKNRINEHKSNI